MRYNICILVLLLFVLSGCEKEINLEHMRPEPKLVLNCLAVQGDTLSVELSRTWFYADNKVKDIFVSGADVKLYVNDVFRESLSEVAVKYEELDIDARAVRLGFDADVFCILPSGTFRIFADIKSRFRRFALPIGDQFQ